MAQFVAFEEDIEVNGETMLAFIKSMKNGEETRSEILANHGLTPDTGKWYNQQQWLDAFEEASDKLGEMNLFLIGKAIIENAQFPPINSLEEGLASIDVAYHMNHRKNSKPLFSPATGSMTEGIGHYSLANFDEKERTAVMVCHNPYPSKFDEGIIAQLVRKFRPSDSIRTSVTLDPDKETRKDGNETCTYKISW